MSESNWMEQLKVGDKVILSGSVFPVERVTAQSVRVCATLFSKQNGRERGGELWHTTYIYQWTPERESKIIAANRKAELANYFNRREWIGYPLETLEAVYALVEQAQKEAEEGKGK